MPGECIFCGALAQSWRSEFADKDLQAWKAILRKTQKNFKHWSYRSAFNAFFAEFLPTLTPLSVTPTGVGTPSLHSEDASQLQTDSRVTCHDSSPSVAVSPVGPSLTPADHPAPTPDVSEILAMMQVMQKEISSLAQSRASTRSSRTRSRSPLSLSRGTSEPGSLNAPFLDSSSRDSTSLSFKSLEPFSFDEKGVWFAVRPHLTFNDDVLIVDNIPRKVIFSQDRLSFMLSSITSDPPLFTSSGSAVEAFQFSLKAQSLSEKKGSASRVLFTDPPSGSHVPLAFRPFMEKGASSILDLLVRDEVSKISSFVRLSSFHAGLTLLPASDWPVSQAILADWASNEPLNISQATSALGFVEEPFMPERLLKAERSARAVVVDLMSTLMQLDHLLNSDPPKSPYDSVLRSSMKGLLFPLKESILNWFMAKLKIRRVFLQDSRTPFGLELLKSSPWHSSLFDPDAVSLVHQWDHNHRGLGSVLNWSSALNKEFKKSHNLLNFSVKGLLVKSTSGCHAQGSSTAASSSGLQPFRSRSRSKSRDKRPRSSSRQFGFKRSREESVANPPSRGNSRGRDRKM